MATNKKSITFYADKEIVDYVNRMAKNAGYDYRGPWMRMLIINEIRRQYGESAISTELIRCK